MLLSAAQAPACRGGIAGRRRARTPAQDQLFRKSRRRGVVEAVDAGGGGRGGESGRGDDRSSSSSSSSLGFARAAASVAVAACLALAGPWLLPLAPPPAHAAAPSSVSASPAAAAAWAAPSLDSADSDETGPRQQQNQQQQKQQQGRHGRDALLALSSELEDELLRASRELDARAGEALGEALAALRNAAAGGGSGGGGGNSGGGGFLPASPAAVSAAATANLTPAELEADASGRELLREVWEVVDAAYLDARGAGFDRAAWRDARDKALAAPPGRYADLSGASARRAAAGMLSRGVRDPYTRLIPPEEFAAMARYDVTGVGLNLGTAEEYVRKTGRALPARAVVVVVSSVGGAGADEAEAATAAASGGGRAAATTATSPMAAAATPPPPGTAGVWVVGLSKGSAADVAGARQGDEVVAVDGARLDDPALAAALAGGGRPAVAAAIAAAEDRSGPAAAAVAAPAAAAAAAATAAAALPPISPFQVSALISGDLLPDGRSADDAPPSAWPPTARLSLRDERGLERALELPRRPRQALPSPVSYRLEVRPAAAAASSGGPLWSLLLRRPWPPTPPPSSAASGAPGTKRVGVVAVSSFSARAQRDVAAAAASLRAQGAEAFELDLRGNRGGLVSEGLEVARLFVGGGAPLVVTQGAAMAADPPRAAPGAALYGDALAPGGGPGRLPLTVLVDGHTASASEIVAGALRDNCRAVLAGPRRTYGKGLIQSVYELSAKNGGGIALTVGKYVTPRGVDIDREGLVPDFARWPVREEEAEKVLRACRLEGERDKGGALGGAAAAAAAAKSGGSAGGK